MEAGDIPSVKMFGGNMSPPPFMPTAKRRARHALCGSSRHSHIVAGVLNAVLNAETSFPGLRRNSERKPLALSDSSPLHGR